MKLSTRKRVIQIIGLLFILLGIGRLVQLILYTSLVSAEELEICRYIILAGYAMIALFIILYLTTGFSVLAYRRWGRALALVSTTITVGMYLSAFISCLWTNLNNIPPNVPADYHVDISNEGSTAVDTQLPTYSTYYFHFSWQTLAIQFVVILLGIYILFILSHQDTKLIFERKGKLEGL